MAAKKGRALNLVAVSTLYWVTSALYTPFLGMYQAQAGVVSWQAGVLGAVAPVCALFIQPLWANLADRLGKRRLILCVLALGASLATLLYISANNFPKFLLAAVVLAVFTSALAPLSDALIIHQAEQSGLNYAFIRIGGTVGYALTVVVTGFLFRTNLKMAFLSAAVMYLVYLATAYNMPKTEPPAVAPVASGGTTAEKGIFKTKEIYIVLAIALVMQMGMMFLFRFLGYYLDDKGYDSSLMGLLEFTSAMSEVPILLFARRMYERFKPIHLLCFSTAVMALRLVLLGIGTLPTFFICQLLNGLSFMVSYYTCVTYVSQNVRPGKIAQGQSALAAVQTGAGSVLGNLLGGFVNNLVGYQTGFFIASAAVMGLLVLVLLARHFVVRRAGTPGEMPEG